MEAIGHAGVKGSDTEALKPVGVRGSSHCMQCGHAYLTFAFPNQVSKVWIINFV